MELEPSQHDLDLSQGQPPPPEVEDAKDEALEQASELEGNQTCPSICMYMCGCGGVGVGD